jgi:hypothetical protein
MTQDILNHPISQTTIFSPKPHSERIKYKTSQLQKDADLKMPSFMENPFAKFS